MELHHYSNNSLMMQQHHHTSNSSVVQHYWSSTTKSAACMTHSMQCMQQCSSLMEWVIQYQQKSHSSECILVQVTHFFSVQYGRVYFILHFNFLPLLTKCLIVDQNKIKRNPGHFYSCLPIKYSKKKKHSRHNE